MANPTLVNYFKENLAKGCSVESVKEELMKAGWPGKEIEEALAEAAPPAAVPAPKPIPVYRLAGIAILVGAVVLATYSAYYYFSFPAQVGTGEEIIPEPLPGAVTPLLPPEPEFTPVPTTPVQPTTVLPAPPATPTPSPPPYPPVIESISNHSITSDSAAISWITNVPSTSRVLYGISATSESVEDKTPATAHYIKLTGLVPNTTYVYRVASCSDSLCRYSATYNFTTLPLRIEVEKIELSPLDPKIFVNESIQFTAKAVLKNGTSMDATSIVAWNSSNSSVGSANASGFFQPASPGTTTINASIQGAWNSTTVTVSKAQLFLLISITPSDFVDYGTTTTAACQSSTTQATPVLSRDGIALGAASEQTILSAGEHSYTCYANETTNFTSAATYATLTVKKTPAVLQLLINGSVWATDLVWNISSQGLYYANFSYSAAAIASTDSGCSFHAFCTIYTTGTFAFTAAHYGDENHTANSIVRRLTIVS